MKIRKSCSLTPDNLKKMFNSLSLNISHSEFLEAIQNDRLNILRKSDLEGVIDFLNQVFRLNGSERIRKDGQKHVLITRIKEKLYNDGTINSSSPATNEITKAKPPPLTTRTSKEQLIFNKINGDPTLENHHTFFHPIVSLKDVIVFENGRIKGECEIDFTEEEFRGLLNGNLEFHIYCIDNFHDQIPTQYFRPINWYPDVCVLVNTNRIQAPGVNKWLATMTDQNSPGYGRPGSNKNFLILNIPITVQKEFLSREKTKIEFTYLEWVPPNYVHFFTVVQKRRTFPQLLSLVNEQTERHLEFSNQRVNEEEDEDDDDDDDDDLVIQGEEVITMIDPLLLTRIENPAKGSECTHLQVFDLQNFFIFSKKSRYMNCPICLKQIPFAKLVIDKKVKYVLAHLDENVEKVKMDLSGNSFTPIDPKTNKLMVTRNLFE